MFLAEIESCFKELERSVKDVLFCDPILNKKAVKETKVLKLEEFRVKYISKEGFIKEFRKRFEKEREKHFKPINGNEGYSYYYHYYDAVNVSLNMLEEEIEKAYVYMSKNI